MYCNDRTDGIVLRFFFFLFLSPAEISKADGQLYLEMCHSAMLYLDQCWDEVSRVDP